MGFEDIYQTSKDNGGSGVCVCVYAYVTIYAYTQKYIEINVLRLPIVRNWGICEKIIKKEENNQVGLGI